MYDTDMPFHLNIPIIDTEPLNTTFDVGDTLFVLGANGSGKSSLMQRLYSMNARNARRISAHRQTWFATNSINLSPEQKRNTVTNIQSADSNLDSRWKDDYSGARASISIYDMIDAENMRAREITKAVDERDMDLAARQSMKDAPVKVINELLRLSNILIEISFAQNDRVLASKSGSPPYSIAELSDGERNALLIAGDVLTAPEGTLFLIDEPERHLHRSIISPLLSQLFAKRPGCAFIVSTHEVMLPLDNKGSRTLLVRGCQYNGSQVASWDANIVPADAGIDEELKKDILGARRKLLFIEGTDNSLDKPLYSLIFPGASIIAKSSCRDVEHAVSGIRDAEGLHWVQAFGIVDNDRRTASDINSLKEKSIYAVSVFSVESIYYHPEIQHRVAKRHSAITGGDAAKCIANAKVALTSAVRAHAPRLSERTAESTIREEVFKNLPTQKTISSAQPVSIAIDVSLHVRQERDRLEEALRSGDIESIVGRYPIRETPALRDIATSLGFTGRSQYEGAVLKLLIDDPDALEFVQGFFGSLKADMDAA